MADVFISYKRQNQDAVQKIVRGLRGAGLSVWWDQDIAPDAPWEATIERELERAKVVVVAWSRAAVASENVKAEARRARQQGKLIQTFVEPCEPPLFFGERQGVDLTKWNGNADDNRFRAVTSAARAILAGRPPPKGVGYKPRKRSSLPLLIAAGAAAVAAGLVTTPAAQQEMCAAVAIPALCAQRQAAATTQPVEVRLVQETPAAAADSAAPSPALAAGVEHRLRVPAGSAIDFDAGTVSDGLTDGSDFVLVEIGGGDFFIDHVAEPAGTRPDTSGRASHAICAPGEYFYRSYLADAGEHNCFKTHEGREGALVRQPDEADFDGAVLTYRFWE